MPNRAYVLAFLLVLIGLYLAGAGGWLVSLGGSAYYLIAGVAVLLSGVLLWLRSGLAPWPYGLMLIGTLIWSVSEVGLDLWALAPRLIAPTILGLWFLMPWVGRSLHGHHRHDHDDGPPADRRVIAALALTALGLAALGGTKLWAQQSRPSPPPLKGSAPDGDWRHYGSTLQGSRYSPLDQIGVKNVGQLQLAWQFRTGDLPRSGETAPREFTSEATPIKVRDTLYTCTPHNIVIALDAVSGKERWRFDPHTNMQGTFVIACRGVSYYEVPNANGPCARRIIGGTLDARLYAIDADRGRLCADFGKGGYVSLLEGMGRVLPGFHYVTSPPTIAKDHIVLGGWISDNQDTDEPSGVIRAFDPVTGRLQWAWDMGVPDRVGAPPPGQSYTRNTPNAWAPFSADPDLNLVYVPTGNAPPDFWGGKRRAFDEKYSSSLVALDLDNGRPKWSFQTTHHDLWDYDVPAQPALVDIPTVNGYEPAVVQATKRGEIFVLNRQTGRPIVPVTEKAVPQGAAPGDRVSATQPFSGLSLLPAKLTEADMWGITPLDQLVCRIKFRRARYDGVFTPPGTRPTIAFPGALGVVDWGGIAIDEGNTLIVANTSAIPYYDQLIPREKAPPAARDVHSYTPRPGEPQADYAWSPQVGTPYVMHLEPFMGPAKVPCTRPPWGFLQMIDLKTQKLIWRRTIGTARDSGPFNIPSMLPFQMGVPNLGGSIVTRGQLIFNGATLDRYLRAYDLITGEELWKARLPAGGQATPMSYMGADGRQYVVITAGGHQGMSTRTGDYILAFALPKKGG